MGVPTIGRPFSCTTSYFSILARTSKVRFLAGRPPILPELPHSNGITQLLLPANRPTNHCTSSRYWASNGFEIDVVYVEMPPIAHTVRTVAPRCKAAAFEQGVHFFQNTAKTRHSEFTDLPDIALNDIRIDNQLTTVPLNIELIFSSNVLPFLFNHFRNCLATDRPKRLVMKPRSTSFTLL